MLRANMLAMPRCHRCGQILGVDRSTADVFVDMEIYLLWPAFFIEESCEDRNYRQR